MALSAEEMEDLADEAGVDYYGDDYSGRGMYGDQVPALEIDNLNQLVGVGMAAERLGLSERDVPKRVDNLGMGYVLY